MLLRIGFEISFRAPASTPMVLLLHVHPDAVGSLQRPERLDVEPGLPVEDYADVFGNPAARLLLPPGPVAFRYDNVIEVPGEPEPAFPGAEQHPVDLLPVETLPFLLPSRYCEVDRLSAIAWDLFGMTRPGWERVEAICDWTHNHIEFGYPYARPTMSAYDAYVERKGVCRDFTHLAVTLCRCMNIPARYATGYLGDIGVPASEDPMDFSAFFEAYLGGRWHPFDARNNARRIGRVLMARGRDAADTALTTTFGHTDLTDFKVWTDQVGVKE